MSRSLEVLDLFLELVTTPAVTTPPESGYVESEPVVDRITRANLFFPSTHRVIVPSHQLNYWNAFLVAVGLKRHDIVSIMLNELQAPVTFLGS